MRPLPGEQPPTGLLGTVEQLQTLFGELLAASLEHPDEPARRYLASARSCARTLTNLTRLAEQEGLPITGPQLPVRLLTALKRWDAAQSAPVSWQRLQVTGQYGALVEQVAQQRFPQGSGFRRSHGMQRLTRQLAERALRLKQTGISWAGLLTALIVELQAELDRDAESQLLLEQLQALQAVTQARDSGAYLRLTVARYRTALDRASQPGLWHESSPRAVQPELPEAQV